MIFELVKHMSQWDKEHTIYVMLPATTLGQIIEEGSEFSEVYFDLYPALTFMIKNDMMEKLSD